MSGGAHCSVHVDAVGVLDEVGDDGFFEDGCVGERLGAGGHGGGWFFLRS